MFRPQEMATWEAVPASMPVSFMLDTVLLYLPEEHKEMLIWIAVSPHYTYNTKHLRFIHSFRTAFTMYVYDYKIEISC